MRAKSVVSPFSQPKKKDRQMYFQTQDITDLESEYYSVPELEDEENEADNEDN